ncbi:MAG: class I SAM-dependent methyltransferase [bacterium]
MLKNKDHWYDGRFYDLFIAPNQDKLFKQIKNLIEPNSKVIDVGCGTGRFSFSAAEKCTSILGIDLSKRNIEQANHSLAKQHNNKISFQHKSISEIIFEKEEHFNYAVMTYVIHEVNEDERIKLLNEIFLIADKIIIGDYLVPKPNGFWGLLNEVVEFVAGNEHYRNYKNFTANGGIIGLVNKAGFRFISEIKNQPSTSHLVIITKNQ